MTPATQYRPRQEAISVENRVLGQQDIDDVETGSARSIGEWVKTANAELGYDLTDPSAMTSPWAQADAFWGAILDRLSSSAEVPDDVFAAWSDVVAEESAAWDQVTDDCWPAE